MRTTTICFVGAVAGSLFMSSILNVSDSLGELETTVQKSVQQNADMKEVHEQRNLERRMREHMKEIECLAKNMYFEARGEGQSGQDAVAFVTINRVRSTKYPDTICEVVYQAKTDHRGIPLRNRCQFSWYCDGKIDSITENVYNRILKRSEFIYINYYLNDLMEDTTDGATHYHSRKVKPYWSKHKNYQYVASIGQHIFYQPTY